MTKSKSLQLRNTIGSKTPGDIPAPPVTRIYTYVLSNPYSIPRKKNRDEAGHLQEGEADLRYGLYQAALIASTRNRAFITYVTTRLTGREREKGIKTRIRVKLAAKMLVIAWTLMKKRQMFDPGYMKHRKERTINGERARARTLRLI